MEVWSLVQAFATPEATSHALRGPIPTVQVAACAFPALAGGQYSRAEICSHEETRVRCQAGREARQPNATP